MNASRPSAWLIQQLDCMAPGINCGNTRRRKVDVALRFDSEATIAVAARTRNWKLAQVGEDYVFAADDYVIRPIV